MKGMVKMKAAVIYNSIHHQNTYKIAVAMSEELNADLLELKDVTSNLLDKYDLIGIGSGIFYGKHHKSLFELVDKIDFDGKDVFVFSTSGNGSKKNNKGLIDKLISKGACVNKSFSCKGYDTFGIFKFFGGIAKGRPNMKDIGDAKEFVRSIKSL